MTTLAAPRTPSEPRRDVVASLVAALVVAMCACSDGPSSPDTSEGGAGPEAAADAPSRDAGSVRDGAADRAAESGRDSDADADADADANRGGDATFDATSDAARDAPSDTRGDAASDAASDGRADDARTADGSDADGQTCVPQEVWPTSARGFTYRQSGGFVAPVPTDAGCVGPSTSYDYIATAQTLAEHSCTFSGRVDRRILLSATQNTQLVSFLAALRTSCQLNGCGADYPDVTLEVRPAAGASTVYPSDFYAGCRGSLVLPPSVAFMRLGELTELLHGFIAAACGGDGGSDASTCTNEAPDAGGSDAAAE